MPHTNREVYTCLNVKASAWAKIFSTRENQADPDSRRGSQKASAELARLAPVPSRPAPDLFCEGAMKAGPANRTSRRKMAVWLPANIDDRDPCAGDPADPGTLGPRRLRASQSEFRALLVYEEAAFPRVGLKVFGFGF
jgi:hypothetical protein